MDRFQSVRASDVRGKSHVWYVNDDPVLAAVFRPVLCLFHLAM